MCKVVVTFSQSNNPHSGAGANALVPMHMHKWGISFCVTVAAALAFHTFANGTSSICVVVTSASGDTLTSHSQNPVANRVSPPTLVDIVRKYG